MLLRRRYRSESWDWRRNLCHALTARKLDNYRLLVTGLSTHYQRSPCFGMSFVAGAGRRGFAPAPPGFIAWCLSRCWARCRKTDEKGGCRSIPPYRSVEATETALGLLPSIALSSAQFGLILLRRDKRRIFAVGSEGMTLKPWGKVVQAKNHLSPQGGTQHAE